MLIPSQFFELIFLLLFLSDWWVSSLMPDIWRLRWFLMCPEDDCRIPSRLFASLLLCAAGGRAGQISMIIRLNTLWIHKMRIVSFFYTKKERYRMISLRRTGSLLLSQSLTIFAVMMLNFCVRHGYRCFHHAIATRSLASTNAQNWTVTSFSLLELPS